MLLVPSKRRHSLAGTCRPVLLIYVVVQNVNCGLYVTLPLLFLINLCSLFYLLSVDRLEIFVLTAVLYTFLKRGKYLMVPSQIFFLFK